MHVSAIFNYICAKLQSSHYVRTFYLTILLLERFVLSQSGDGSSINFQEIKGISI